MRFFKTICLIVLMLTFSLSIINIKAFNFASSEIVTEDEEINKVELEGGTYLYQHKLSAYNDGIISDERLNNYNVSWLDYGDNKNVRIVNWSTGTSYNWVGGKVSSLAKNYEKNNPGWRVVGGVNGDFFNISGNCEVMNVSIQEGDLYKPVGWTSLGTGVIGWTHNGKIVEGRPTISSEMYLEEYDEYGILTNTRVISNINNGIKDHDINLITKDLESYEKQVEYDLSGATVVEVTFDVNRYAAIGNETKDRIFIKGTITDISTNKGKKELIPYGCVYLVAKDNSLDGLSIGDNVKMQYHFTGAWANVVNTTGYYAKILSQGKSLFYQSSYNDYSNIAADTSYINCLKNRTVIGEREDGSTVLMTIEYDKNLRKFGASYYECAEFLKSVGCVNGWLLDGGGSTSLVVRDSNGDFKMMAGGSDGNERSDGNGIFFVVKDPGITPRVEKASRFSVDITLDENGSPFRDEVFDIYVTINGQTLEYGNDTESLHFEGLEENTKYNIDITYKMYNEDGSIYNGKMQSSFETYDFAYPTINFTCSQISSNEIVVDKEILCQPDIDVRNCELHVGDNVYYFYQSTIICKNLSSNTEYEVYITCDAYDKVTGKTYPTKSEVITIKTLEKAIPIITKFSKNSINGTTLYFDYEYMDTSSVVKEAYLMCHGKKTILKYQGATVAIEGVDVTKENVAVDLILECYDGTIINKQIVIEKMDKLPYEGNPLAGKHRKSCCSCSKKNTLIIVELLSMAIVFIGIFKKKNN